MIETATDLEKDCFLDLHILLFKYPVCKNELKKNKVLLIYKAK